MKPEPNAYNAILRYLSCLDKDFFAIAIPIIRLPINSKSCCGVINNYYYFFFKFSKYFSSKQYSKVKIYIDPTSLILNLEIPCALPFQLIDVIT